MQGYSGTYAINGVDILQPTQHRWLERDLLGYDGEGRPVYPALGEIELSWQLMSTSDLKKLIDAQRLTVTTGSSVVDLPEWGNNDYRFLSYSGTFINRVNVGSYFSEHVEDVVLIISNIRTD